MKLLSSIPPLQWGGAATLHGRGWHLPHFNGGWQLPPLQWRVAAPPTAMEGGITGLRDYRITGNPGNPVIR